MTISPNNELTSDQHEVLDDCDGDRLGDGTWCCCYWKRKTRPYHIFPQCLVSQTSDDIYTTCYQTKK